MILTGPAIHQAVIDGNITIEPFNPKQIGPNSYDFRLGNRCKVYKNHQLDCAIENPIKEFIIAENGIVLRPNRIYLINTLEKMGSTKYVPIIRGRSSVGRLGIYIDITADLIDIGSINQWTLQLRTISPVRIYPNMLIGQVTSWAVKGEIVLYAGKYSSFQSPVASLAYLDFHGKEK